MSRYIDANAVEKVFFEKTYPCEVEDIIAEIDNIPAIKTKEIKYYDEDENVWKIGKVIVNE